MQNQSSNQSPKRPGARVLIVDDNRDSADSLAALLELDDYVTLGVYSAAEAIRQAAEFRPNALLLDIGLPQMDGYEVARRIRATDKSVRLIALSGYGRAEDRQRSVAAGFDAHLLKPVDFDALHRELAQIEPAAAGL